MPESEVDSRIALLEIPTGGGPDVLEKGRAAEWLLANAEHSYPVLLARVTEGRAGPAAIELLGRFGREDGVDALAALLEEEGARGFAAARSLASHSSPAALAALGDAMRRGGEQAVLSADALATRGDASACPGLLEAAKDADPRLRYHAVQAAAALECLPAEQLAELASADPDPDVRELANRLGMR